MLLGNQTVLLRSPGRFMAGQVGQFRSAWDTNGASRNAWAGAWNAKASVPDGYRHPYAAQMAQKPGGMARFTYAQDATSDATGLLAGGKAAAADLTGTGSITSAQLALVVSAIADLTGSGAISGTAAGKLEAIATLAGTGDFDAAIGALAGGSATVTGTGTASVTARATGTLTADITPFSELSPESLSRSVWEQQPGDFDPGTFGANLDAPVSSIGGGSITEEGIAEEVLDVLMNDPRFLTVAKFLGLK